MGVKVAFLGAEPSRQRAKNQDPAPTVRALIPKSAVRTEGGNSFVFAVRDGKLERRAVSLGRAIAGDMEVIAGVNAGDELVVSGPENLRDSERVSVRTQ
jgi:multidrug efflux pump subunit AcrA (membrane-fusion protein)